jgi:branched-chain amino acid transport system ATP-binding protein
MKTVLGISGLTVRYGGVVALSDVALSVGEGELVGLIGPNGAGKTTCIDAISGFAKSRGTVELDGRAIDRLPPHVRSQRGLARTWQLGELFEDLTIRENLSVAALPSSFALAVRDVFSPRIREDPRIDNLIQELGLADIADRSAAELTEGQRKLVGVGRALASRPQVVLLDEPGAGLDSSESIQLGRTLRSLLSQGTGMLLVDHDMGLVMSVCDRIVVLDFGEVIANGTPDEVRADDAVIAAYLGGSATSTDRRPPALTTAAATAEVAGR